MKWLWPGKNGTRGNAEADLAGKTVGFRCRIAVGGLGMNLQILLLK